MVDDWRKLTFPIARINILLKSIFDKDKVPEMVIFSEPNMRKMAFANLFGRIQKNSGSCDYADGMKRYAFTLLKDEQAAKGIVEYVYSRSASYGKEVVDPSDLRLYLYQSVYFHCKKRMAAVNGSVIPAQPDEIPCIETKNRENHGSDQWNQYMLGLPLFYQEILCKSRLEKKNFSEIALEMNHSVRSIKKQMAKAFRLLKEQWSHDGKINKRPWMTS